MAIDKLTQDEANTMLSMGMMVGLYTICSILDDVDVNKIDPKAWQTLKDYASKELETLSSMPGEDAVLIMDNVLKEARKDLRKRFGFDK